MKILKIILAINTIFHNIQTQDNKYNLESVTTNLEIHFILNKIFSIGIASSIEDFNLKSRVFGISGSIQTKIFIINSSVFFNQNNSFEFKYATASILFKIKNLFDKIAYIGFNFFYYNEYSYAPKINILLNYEYKKFKGRISFNLPIFDQPIQTKRKINQESNKILNLKRIPTSKVTKNYNSVSKIFNDNFLKQGTDKLINCTFSFIQKHSLTIKDFLKFHKNENSYYINKIIKNNPKLNLAEHHEILACYISNKLKTTKLLSVIIKEFSSLLIQYSIFQYAYITNSILLYIPKLFFQNTILFLYQILIGFIIIGFYMYIDIYLKIISSSIIDFLETSINQKDQENQEDQENSRWDNIKNKTKELWNISKNITSNCINSIKSFKNN